MDDGSYVGSELPRRSGVGIKISPRGFSTRCILGKALILVQRQGNVIFACPKEIISVYVIVSFFGYIVASALRFYENFRLLFSSLDVTFIFYCPVDEDEEISKRFSY